MTGASQEFTDRFRENLRRHRRNAALSQEELGFLASVHRTEVGLLEHGRRLPRIDTLVKLAASLEVTPNDLLDGIEWLPARDQVEGSCWMRVGTTWQIGRRTDA